MAEAEPQWLVTARSLIGTQEVSGSADNPAILKWPAIIAAKFPSVPGLNTYCALYTNDEIAWCGLFEAVCFAINGVMPVFGSGDLQRFLWAQGWKGFGVALHEPRLGCVLVFARHVGFYVGEEGESYLVLGGNQSDGVNIKRFAKSSVEAMRWPSDPALQVATAQPVLATTTSSIRVRMAKAIVDFEARRDSQGRLAVYQLPAGDGGGTYEVAGINDRYHPTEAAHLRDLIGQGRYDEAEAYIAEFLLKYTNVALGWANDPGVEFYLRDCVFNRGPTGAARIFQRALGVEEDGEVGPITLTNAAAADPLALLNTLRVARESYERSPVGRDESSQFWKGLVNRWNNALTIARRFSAEAPALADPIDIPPFIKPPPNTSGKPMPNGPTPYNAALEDCVIELAKAQRPIIERYLKTSQTASPEALKAELIRMLGGTPPPVGVLLLPPPTDPAKPVDPAAPPVTPLPTTSTAMTNVAGGGIGVILSLLAGALGFTGTMVGPEQTTTGILLPAVAAIAGFAGIPAPIVNIVAGLWSKLRGKK